MIQIFKWLYRSRFLLMGLILAKAICDQTALADDVSVMQNGKWRITYDLKTGTMDIAFGDNMVFRTSYAVVRLSEVITSKDFAAHGIKRREIKDGFGRGVEFAVDSSNDDGQHMVQTFCVYDHLDYI